MTFEEVSLIMFNHYKINNLYLHGHFFIKIPDTCNQTSINLTKKLNEK